MSPLSLWFVLPQCVAWARRGVNVGYDAVAGCVKAMLQFDAGVACCVCLRHTQVKYGPIALVLWQVLDYVSRYPGLAALSAQVPWYLLAGKLARATSWPGLRGDSLSLPLVSDSR